MKTSLETALLVVVSCTIPLALYIAVSASRIAPSDMTSNALAGIVVVFVCVCVPYYFMYFNNNDAVPLPSVERPSIRDDAVCPVCTPCPLLNEYIGFINQAAQEVYLREKNQPNYTVETNIPTPTFPPLVQKDVNQAIAQQLVQSTSVPLWLRSYWEVLVSSINGIVAEYIIPQQREYIQSSVLPGVLDHVDNLVSNSECGITSYADSWTPLTCSGTVCTLNIQSDTGGPVRKLHVDANVTMHKVTSPTLNTNEYSPTVCAAS